MRDLDKLYRMIERTGSIGTSWTDEKQVVCYNMYIGGKHYNRQTGFNKIHWIRKFYYKVTLIRNEHNVFCIPISIEKKYY